MEPISQTLPPDKLGTVADDDRLMSLVESALALPADLRQEFIVKSCDAEELRAAATDYIRREERMERFLLDPIVPRPRGAESPFESGQVIEQRFRIVREIARGGMGIVYEAFDEKLERPIAIKCAKSAFRKRLPPEVRNASEISHPNVCKIFEIHTAHLAQGETDFLTMEYLEGETLAERLRRSPVPEAEARVIARQLCDGLAEAHHNKVIHGDLKSNNVILTNNADGEMRAVITDFGLARRPNAQPNALPSTPIGGTPDYMAPELWKGEKASEQSDIFALGIIMYEMIAGKRPFDSATNGEASATRRLQPVNPKWDDIFRRCLDAEPQKRFQRAEQIAQALTPPRHLSRWLIAVAALLVALASWGVYQQTRPPDRILRLALLPFAKSELPVSTTNAMLQDASDRLSRARPGRTRFTLIPFSDALNNRAATAADAKKILGATHALVGSLGKENQRIKLQFTLVDTTTLIPVAGWLTDYDENELNNMPGALAGTITEKLGLPALKSAASVNKAAYSTWSEGVALMRGDPRDIDRALALLERAVTLDPNSPLTHARLAEAKLQKYEYSGEPVWRDRARDSLKSAEQRNPDAPEVHFVAARVESLFGHTPQAESHFQRALEIEPANGDLWRELGKVQRDAGRYAEAFNSFKKALELQPNYYRNYQSLGEYYFVQSKLPEAIRQWQMMVQTAPQLAEAHLELARPYLNKGHWLAGETELRHAAELRETSNTIHTLAVALSYQGKDRDAIPYFLHAIELGPTPNNRHLIYINLGSAYRRLGLSEKARESYILSKDLAYAALKNRPNDGAIRAALGYVQAQLGKQEEAAGNTEQALSPNPKNATILWWAVQTSEVLSQRENTLALLRDAPAAIILRLNLFSDMAGLQHDPRFQQQWEKAVSLNNQ